MPEAGTTKKVRVHFEASAAIGVEVEVEVDLDEKGNWSEYQANKRAKALNVDFTEIVGNLLKPDKQATIGYAGASGKPITYVTVEEDESGFDIVDAFEVTEERQ